MSSVEVSKLDASSKSSLALSYASLLLSSASLPITSENLQKVISAANVPVNKGIVELYGKLLNGKDVKSFFAAGGNGGSAAPASAPAESKKEVAKEAPKPKEEEKKPGNNIVL